MHIVYAACNWSIQHKGRKWTAERNRLILKNCWKAGTTRRPMNLVRLWPIAINDA